MKKNELLSAFRFLQTTKPHLAGSGGRCAGNAAAFAVGAFTRRQYTENGGIHRPNNCCQPVPDPAGTAAGRAYQSAAGGGTHQGHGHLDHWRRDRLCGGHPDRDMQQQETHVLLQDGSALAETTYLPQVCGIAVLCEGGGDVRVAARITELLHSLLDLPTNRICVEQRKR